MCRQLLELSGHPLDQPTAAVLLNPQPPVLAGDALQAIQQHRLARAATGDQQDRTRLPAGLFQCHAELVEDVVAPGQHQRARPKSRGEGVPTHLKSLHSSQSLQMSTHVYSEHVVMHCTVRQGCDSGQRGHPCPQMLAVGRTVAMPFVLGLAEGLLFLPNTLGRMRCSRPANRDVRPWRTDGDLWLNRQGPDRQNLTCRLVPRWRT